MEESEDKHLDVLILVSNPGIGSKLKAFFKDNNISSRYEYEKSYLESRSLKELYQEITPELSIVCPKCFKVNMAKEYMQTRAVIFEYHLKKSQKLDIIIASEEETSIHMPTEKIEIPRLILPANWDYMKSDELSNDLMPQFNKITAELGLNLK